MDTSSPAINKVLFIVCGVAFLVPALFFAFYTLRPIYVNLAAEDAAAHRTGGMLIGAIAFPLATMFIGIVSRFFFKRAASGIPK